jgi:dihydroorotase
MSLTEVIEAATVRPAQVLALDQEIGTLKPGALADVALFQLESGEFTFYDVHMNARTGKELLRNTLTIINGRKLDVTADDPVAPWIELSEAQQQLIERGHTPDALCLH